MSSRILTNVISKLLADIYKAYNKVPYVIYLGSYWWDELNYGETWSTYAFCGPYGRVSVRAAPADYSPASIIPRDINGDIIEEMLQECDNVKRALLQCSDIEEPQLPKQLSFDFTSSEEV